MSVNILTYSNAPKVRRDNAEALAEQLGGDVYVGGRNCAENVLGILNKSKNEGTFFIEDDAIITDLSGFQEYIDTLPDTLINFYYPEVERIQLLQGSRYKHNVCLYIPKNINAMLRYDYNNYVTQMSYSNNRNAFATYFMYVLHAHNKEFLAIPPTISGVSYHKEWGSTING